MRFNFTFIQNLGHSAPRTPPKTEQRARPTTWVRGPRQLALSAFPWQRPCPPREFYSGYSSLLYLTSNTCFSKRNKILYGSFQRHGVTFCYFLCRQGIVLFKLYNIYLPSLFKIRIGRILVKFLSSKGTLSSLSITVLWISHELLWFSNVILGCYLGYKWKHNHGKTMSWSHIIKIRSLREVIHTVNMICMTSHLNQKNRRLGNSPE